MNVGEDRRGYRFAAEITFVNVSGKALIRLELSLVIMI